MRRCNQTGISSNQTSLATLLPERNADRSECEPPERAFLWNDRPRRLVLAALMGSPGSCPSIVENGELNLEAGPSMRTRAQRIGASALLKTKTHTIGALPFHRVLTASIPSDHRPRRPEAKPAVGEMGSRNIAVPTLQSQTKA